MAAITKDEGWGAREFSGISVGDKRLGERIKKIAEQMGARPQASINHACGDWADAKAAYRLFDNEKIKSTEILRPHRQRVIERMVGQEQVLVIQDTTDLNYTKHKKTKGLGSIGGVEETAGLIVHTAMVATTEGLPLGVLCQQVWGREEREEIRVEGEHKNQPVEEKESQKWIDPILIAEESFPEEVKAVMVSDRESDVFEFLLSAKKHGVSFAIRANQDRRLYDSPKRLWSELEGQTAKGRFTVEVAAKDKMAAREAELTVRFSTVTLRPPQRLERNRPDNWRPITVQAILAREEHPPEGVEPLEWMLLTDLPVKNIEDAFEKLRWYRLRWLIELYHKVLKSGLHIEECRLQTRERLQRYIALRAVIGWRLLWLSYINRQNPTDECSIVLSEPEWQALYCTIHKTTILPDKAPTVREVVRWIAKLGGFLGRKSDGEPGIIVLWRGWQRLSDIVDTWRLLTSTYG